MAGCFSKMTRQVEVFETSWKLAAVYATAEASSLSALGRVRIKILESALDLHESKFIFKVSFVVI